MKNPFGKKEAPSVIVGGLEKAWKEEHKGQHEHCFHCIALRHGRK